LLMCAHVAGVSSTRLRVKVVSHACVQMGIGLGTSGGDQIRYKKSGLDLLMCAHVAGVSSTRLRIEV